MRGRMGIAMLAGVLGMGAASAALACETAQPAAGAADVAATQSDEDFIFFSEPHIMERPVDTTDFILIADLRLPTLADLSKERWNQVHRRYDSGRGRREKIRA